VGMVRVCSQPGCRARRATQGRPDGGIARRNRHERETNLRCFITALIFAGCLQAQAVDDSQVRPPVSKADLQICESGHARFLIRLRNGIVPITAICPACRQDFQSVLRARKGD